MSDPLRSWNEGETKTRILASIAAMVDESSDEFVVPEKRVATFDNDGTLWTEKPTYVQAAFLIAHWKDVATRDPAKRKVEPYRAAYEDDVEWLGDLRAHLRALERGIRESFVGISPEEYELQVRQFFLEARHPRFGHPFTELGFEPMRELLDHLRANGFKVFVCTGGGRDFVRVVGEDMYGVEREQVIGSAPELEFIDGAMVRTGKLDGPLDDGPGKLVHIYARVGFPPAIAVGNSDGDIEMLASARFAILLRHDDADREYAYDDGATEARELAAAQGWVVASIRDDFARVFASDPTP